MKFLSRPLLAAFVFLTLAGPALAKRGPEPEVPPVTHGILEFRVPNSLEKMGIVEVWNTRTETKQQDLRVYRVAVWPLLETDTQWIFIKSMAVVGRDLVVINERDKVYKIPLRLIRNSEPKTIR